MHYKRRSRRRAKGRWASCGCCEIITPGKEPIEDGPCMGKALSKRVKPKKERCPVNGVHEWYVERSTEHHTSYYSDYEWDSTYDVSTCVHCWKVKKKPVRQPYRWASRKLALPKREVKF